MGHQQSFPWWPFDFGGTRGGELASGREAVIPWAFVPSSRLSPRVERIRLDEQATDVRGRPDARMRRSAGHAGAAAHEHRGVPAWSYLDSDPPGAVQGTPSRPRRAR